jgi:hypothetical protein
LDLAVRQIVSRAVAPEGVVDIFAAAGLKKPDISILSDEFLAEVQGMPQRNLAVELLRKLLSGEIHTQRRANVVQARSFAEMLAESIRRYQNRAIEAAQVIEELIGLAKDMRAANARGEALGLSAEELAFYDALEVNDSAVQVLGEPTLKASRVSSQTQCAATSPSIGRCGRTCGPRCACASGASCADMVTRPISRSRRRRRCSSRRRCSHRPGRRRKPLPRSKDLREDLKSLELLRRVC